MPQYISFDVPIPPIPLTGSGEYCITIDRKYIPYIVGALQALLHADTYESDAQDSIYEATDLIAAIQTGGCEVSVPIGTISQYATATVPDGYLDCDGAEYDKVDYPDLYAVLHANYIIDANTFAVPDFRGRAPIGIGTGAGLSARAMNDSVGVETQSLTIANLPAHAHTMTVYGGGHNTSAGSNIDLSANSTNQTTKSTSSQGSDTAHNNMQPSRATGFCIKAL